ncbi:MAG: glycosyltransferase family 2 protein [Bryobacteraceae bacterium]
MTPSALPLVSVVTPTYNMANYLTETIESVLSQDYPNIEYIVVDGGSTDTTLEILKSYQGRLRYLSEPDRGPSDAAAKGFRQASGEIFAWLNADDTYLPGAVRKGVEYLQSNPETDVAYGEGWWIDESGANIGRYPTFPFDAKILERECFICQPSAFIRAAAYRRCGLDPAITQAFDYDLWIRMAKAGIQFRAFPDYLANSRMHAGAKTLRERENVFDASMGLLKRHYGYIPLPWIFGYTAYRLDHRDQFFEPLQYNAWKYLASLPVGLWYNRRKPLRFMTEWLVKGGRELVRRR